MPRVKKGACAAILLAGLLIDVKSCRKEGDESILAAVKSYVRIAQMDAIGYKTYSKIVDVINNN